MGARRVTVVDMAKAQLRAAVLSLPEEERAEIALELLRSLPVEGAGAPALSDREWVEAWRDEAVARDEELDGDAADGLSGDDVFRAAREAVAERKRVRGR